MTDRTDKPVDKRILLVAKADLSEVTSTLKAFGNTLDTGDNQGANLIQQAFRGEWTTFEGLLVAYDDVVQSSKAHRTIRAWQKLPLLANWPVLISAFAGLEMTFKGIRLEEEGSYDKNEHSLYPLFQSLPEQHQDRIRAAASKWLEKSSTSLEDLLRSWNRERRIKWFYLPLEKKWDMGSMWNPGHVLSLWGIALKCWAQVDGYEDIVRHLNIDLPDYTP